MTRATNLLIATFVILSSAYPALATCRNQAGFPIFQCGDRAYFEPVPEGGGAIEAVFWQIGFGNRTVSNGKGSSGVGVAPVGVFNGNDSGLWELDVVSAKAILKDEKVPDGALCLAPANWGNPGIDGCCDNARDPIRNRGDGFLNPYFMVRERRQDQVIETLENVQDYPIAVLLKEETGRYFALAAVAVASRNADPNDVRTGHFTLADVSNGGKNPITGASNIIPWQKVPGGRMERLSGEPDGNGRYEVKLSWDPVVMHSDQSVRPSEAYEIDNPGHGVGVADMGPLVWYTVDRAPVSEGAFGEEGYPLAGLMLWEQVAETRESAVELEAAPDECLLVKARFGKMPRSKSITVNTCALGRCGDIGYFVTGKPVCLEGPVLARTGESGKR